MRSIMMKVNYDPKYMFPNSSPAKSSDRTLNDRLGVMKGIYRNPERNTRGRLYEVSPKRVVQVCQNVPKPKQSSGAAVVKKTGAIRISEPEPACKRSVVNQESLPPLCNPLGRRSRTTVQSETHRHVTSKSAPFSPLPPQNNNKHRDKAILKSCILSPQPPLNVTVNVSTSRHNNKPDVEHSLDRSKTITFGECFSVLKTSGQRKFERRARKLSDRAIKSGKVFTIVGPYPSLRQALRRRGWVEKINSMPSDNDTSNISSIQAALGGGRTEHNDGSGKTSIFRPWWFEDNGFFLIMSYMVRNTMPSFVFTVRSVDTKLLSVDQLVNHFEQARQFTTKAGLCQNVRNVTWFDKIDADSFYPRSYRLDEITDRSDFIDDYHMTACFGFLKHLVGYHTADENADMYLHVKAAVVPVLFCDPSSPVNGPAHVPSGAVSGPAHVPSGAVSGPAHVPSGAVSGPAHVPSSAVNGLVHLPSGATNGPVDASSSAVTQGHGRHRSAPPRQQGATVQEAGASCSRQVSSHSLVLPGVTLEKTSSLASGVVASTQRCFSVALLSHPCHTPTDPGTFCPENVGHDCVLRQALNTAIRHCEYFVSTKEHKDIDMMSNISLQEEDWDRFLNCYYKFVHSNCRMSDVSQQTFERCAALLQRLRQLWPQFELDGCDNVWILKPGAKSRGRGIVCLNKLKKILDTANESPDTIMVIQKYIERPFLMYRTKFDIRQWFLVTSWKPLILWFYNDCYLRFCGQEFTLQNFHASIHLSNNSVQKSYENGVRSPLLPEDNMWTRDEFMEYLKEHGMLETWQQKTIPAMQQSVLCCLLCSQEHIEGRKNAFELYGADFMLTEDLSPWLLEINSSPCMSKSTHATAQLVDQVMEDTLKVVLDRKKERNCETGGFELVYKQPLLNDPMPQHKALLIQGRGVRKRNHTTKR